MMKNRSRPAVALLVGFAAAMLCGGAGSPRRPSVRWPLTVAGAMSFAFVDIPSGRLMTGNGSAVGQIDLGKVSSSGPTGADLSLTAAGAGFKVSAKFGVMVNDPSNRARTASLMAWLPVPAARVTIQIDGVPVDSVPRIICPHIAAGRITEHRVDIAVPGDLTEENAHVLNNIQFMLVPE